MRANFASLSLSWAVLLVSLAAQAQEAPPERPAKWALPLEKAGLPNLHKVSDTLYRGAQPTAEGMKALEAMGVRTVVNLRSLHSDEDEAKGTKLFLEDITSVAWTAKEEDILRFLQIAMDQKRQPLFVHCQHGADRTGLMVVMYRIIVQGWTKAEAVAEMTQGGFGFHVVWLNLLTFIQDVDIDRLRSRLKISATP